jgi:hypothetical protein
MALPTAFLLVSVILHSGVPSKILGTTTPSRTTTLTEDIKQTGPNLPISNLPAPVSPVQNPDLRAAEAKALAGKYQLHLGHITEAQNQCSAVLTIDPQNKTAMEGLDLAARMAIDDQLNKADNLILDRKPSDAFDIAASLVHSQASLEQQPGQGGFSEKQVHRCSERYGQRSLIGFAR